MSYGLVVERGGAFPIQYNETMAALCVAGYCVLGPVILESLVQKVSVCFSRALTALRSFDRAFQFPMAAAAKSIDVVKKEIEMMDKLTTILARHNEFEDVNQRIEALSARAKSESGSESSFAEEALVLFVDVMTALSEPAPWAVDAVLESIREEQVDVVMEGLGKIKALKEEQLAYFHRIKSDQAKKERWNRLIHRHNELVTQFNEAVTGDQNARRFAIEMQKAMQPKIDRIDELEKEMTRLETQLKKTRATMEDSKNEIAEANRQYKQWKKYYSSSQLRELEQKNKNFNIEMGLLIRIVEGKLSLYTEKTAERNRLRIEHAKILADFKLAQANIERFGDQIRRLKARMSVHDEL